MKYGFIGCGNMGGAIAKALSRKCTDFSITDRSGKAVGLAVELCFETDCKLKCSFDDGPRLLELLLLRLAQEAKK